MLEGYKALNRDRGQEPAASSISKPEYFHPFYDTLKETHASVSTETSISAAEQTYSSGLGILLLIIDDLPLEAFWRVWLEAYNESATRGEVRLWVHAKHPERVRSQWVRDRFVKTFQLRPEWGSVEITSCMFKMLKEAMTDAPDIAKFAFASESCLPIMPLGEVFDVIDVENKACGENSSWVQYINTPNNGYARQQQWDALHHRLPEQCIYKADQWVLLSRAHAQAVIDLDQKCEETTNKPLIDVFRKVRASDEMFFPCCLAVLGAISKGEVCKKRLAYCDWSVSVKNPKTYTTLEPQALAEASSQRSVFIRKVKIDVGSGEQRQAMLAWPGVRGVGSEERVDAVLRAVAADRGVTRRPLHRSEDESHKRSRLS